MLADTILTAVAYMASGRECPRLWMRRFLSLAMEAYVASSPESFTTDNAQYQPVTPLPSYPHTHYLALPVFSLHHSADTC